MKYQEFTILGVPSRYFGVVAVISTLISSLLLMTGIIETLIPMGFIFVGGWLAGVIMTWKNPEFFTDFVYRKFPRMAKSMFKETPKS